mmetsp:Transcript_30545/g.55789  ORF Transcript_30545/g.55789 Transcript_30545/m.55789 type:complete len:138 (-) Transcript_30545:46-459(-)
MVLIPKKTRKQIMEHIFKEGVIVVKHDPNACRHNDPELADIPNLHVMMVTRSLCSGEYLTEVFNWRWHYYFLTNKGIEYLREQLHLPPHVMPSTLTKARPSKPQLLEGGTSGDGEGKGWGKGKGKGKGWGKSKESEE